MNNQVERVHGQPESLRQLGDRLTGGGARALLHRLAGSMQRMGNRLTGGGLRSLSKSIATKSLRIAMSQPTLKALGRGALKPFPNFSGRLFRLATAPDTVSATTADTASVASSSLTQRRDPSLLVNSLYKTAFGRVADPDGLATWSHQLELGPPLEALAEQIALSAEFLSRHGPDRGIDMVYVASLYRDGLGHAPSLGNLAFWLEEGKRGAKRAKPLAVVASSEEALQRLRLRDQDSDTTYARWVAQNDTIGDMDRVMIRTHIAGLPYSPLISVILLIDSTAKVALCETVKSVTTQLFPNWELCVTIDEDSEPLLGRILRDLKDPRIKTTKSDYGKGTTTLANAALTLATGEFVTILRGGDILPENALYEVAVELGRNAGIDIVYSDNDQVGPDGKRFGPWFKPGWDPDLLLAQDYLSQLAVYRRTLVEAVGLMRADLEGAEFHDLALRATVATTAVRIQHIPAILYHKREDNPAIRSDNELLRLRVIANARRAVRDHLDSQGEKDAILQPTPHMPDAVRVIWPIPAREPSVSVIIPTRDRADLVSLCIDGVLCRTAYRNLELIIVDNHSVEADTFALFDRLTRSDNRVRVLHRPGPFNYAALNNTAAREAKGEILLLLNNDTNVIESGWLRELVSHAVRPDVGIVGAKLLYANGRVQHAGVVLGPEGQATHQYRLTSSSDDLGYFGQLELTRTLSAVTGACAAIRRAVFFEVGGFDERNLPVTLNDVDLCLRLGDYGYRVVWTPFAELFHLECASWQDNRNPSQSERLLRDLQHMRKTWGTLMESSDPFHNPNLLFAPDYFEIPSSPRRQKPWISVSRQIPNLKQNIPLAQEAA
jgi:GT2 family glycosyltransferase